MDFLQQFRVKPDRPLRLQDIDPDAKGGLSKASAQDIIESNAKRLNALQGLLYAEHKRSLLICLQAMDTGGKDGVISHVVGAMNPQGCKVVSFKQPSKQELDHDFLWRMHAQAPAKGEVAVFNRSHYEDVLVARVHKLVTKSAWEQRYAQINAMEKILADNGTHIVKFFLHISNDEQLERFKDRLDDPAKHWKISESDYIERQYWKDYMQAFEDMLNRCSTEQAPWFVIPANHKWFRDLAVSSILVAYLEGLNMAFPDTTVDLGKIRKEYFA